MNTRSNKRRALLGLIVVAVAASTFGAEAVHAACVDEGGGQPGPYPDSNLSTQDTFVALDDHLFIGADANGGNLVTNPSGSGSASVCVLYGVGGNKFVVSRSGDTLTVTKCDSNLVTEWCESPSLVQASVTQDTNGTVAVSGTRDASGWAAVSGTGSANAEQIGVSGMGSASGDDPPSIPSPQVSVWHPLDVVIQEVEPGIVVEPPVIWDPEVTDQICGEAPQACDLLDPGSQASPTSGISSASSSPRVIRCRLDNAAWRFVGRWEVETVLGAFRCSEPIAHNLMSKNVRRHFWSWADDSIRTYSVGYDDFWGRWYAQHTIRSRGTYHVHVRDLARALDGTRSYIIYADGQDYHCHDSHGCHL